VGTPPHFRIETLESGSGITITLAGELDSATCLELLERFNQAIAAPGVRRLVLDLEAVSFIDSAGMRAIIMIERVASEREVMLSISPPHQEVTDLLHVAGIGDRMGLAPVGDDAPHSAPFIERIDIDFGRDPNAPGRARAELRDALRERLPHADLAIVTLLTSELVTNAVIHPGPAAGSSIGLRITAYPDRVRIEVTDAGAGFDVGKLPPRPREAGGHGLIVVEGLSSRWGTCRRAIEGAEGFCVWFELDVAVEPCAPLSQAEAARR
jgi:anti-anti-sigma factor